MFGSVVGLSALAIVAGIVAGATMLLPFESARPGRRGPMTTGTLNGITITHPAAWILIDPDEAGLNWPRGRPRFLGSSSRCHRSHKSTASAVPGMADGEPPTFLMTVQEEPLALAGDAVRPGRQSLEPMNRRSRRVGLLSRLGVPARRLDDRGSDVRGRVGFAPDASEDDREALFAAFASMTFAPSHRGIDLGGPHDRERPAARTGS